MNESFDFSRLQSGRIFSCPGLLGKSADFRYQDHDNDEKNIVFH
jgi:hypothetical protein